MRHVVDLDTCRGGTRSSPFSDAAFETTPPASVFGPYDLVEFEDLVGFDIDALICPPQALRCASRSNTIDTETILDSMDFTTMMTRVNVFDGETMTSMSISSCRDVRYIDCGELATLTRIVNDLGSRDHEIATGSSVDRSIPPSHLENNELTVTTTFHLHIPIVFVSSYSMNPTSRARVDEDETGNVRIFFNAPSPRICAVYVFRVDLRHGTSCIVVTPRFEDAMLRFAAGGVCFESTVIHDAGCATNDGTCVSLKMTSSAFDAVCGPTTGSKRIDIDTKCSSFDRDSIRDIIDSSSSDEDTKLIAKTAVALIPRRKLGLIKLDVARAMEIGDRAIAKWTTAFSNIFVTNVTNATNATSAINVANATNVNKSPEAS